LDILVPVDGSENALRALRHVLSAESTCRHPERVHVLNVQPAVASGVVRMFVAQSDIDGFYREEAEQALAAARAEVERANVPHVVEFRVGDIGETIARYARQEGCKLIAMGTRGMGSMSNLLLGSAASKVISLTSVPVLLVK
jgi:nucleotide-binding universal stress UspA family protein